MTTIDAARRALVEARTGLEAERDAITEQIDRLNIAIGALGPEWVPIADGIGALGPEWGHAPYVPEATTAPANPVVIVDRQPRAARSGAIDWAEVIETVREMKMTGTYTAAGLIERYGTTHVKNWKAKARELGIPLDGLEVDHQAARDAAALTAAPIGGGSSGLTGTGYEPSRPLAPKPAPLQAKFTVDDAVRVIEGAA